MFGSVPVFAGACLSTMDLKRSALGGALIEDPARRPIKLLTQKQIGELEAAGVEPRRTRHPQPVGEKQSLNPDRIAQSAWSRHKTGTAQP
jgi:hypothetical protein